MKTDREKVVELLKEFGASEGILKDAECDNFLVCFSFDKNDKSSGVLSHIE